MKTPAIFSQARNAAKDRNSEMMQKIIERLPDPMHLPLICDVNAVGFDAHIWAWDELEKWQLS